MTDQIDTRAPAREVAGKVAVVPDITQQSVRKDKRYRRRQTCKRGLISFDDTATIIVADLDRFAQHLVANLRRARLLKILNARAR